VTDVANRSAVGLINGDANRIIKPQSSFAFDESNGRVSFSCCSEPHLAVSLLPYFSPYLAIFAYSFLREIFSSFAARTLLPSVDSSAR
jgi:hypothetical protein